MTEASGDILSAERSVAAFEWLREFLPENLDKSQAEREIAQLQPTPTVVRTIESLRSFLTRRMEAERTENETIMRQTREFEVELERWKQAGCDEVRDRLDPDAIAEVDILSEICAELELSPGHAASKGRRIAAVSRIAQHYLSEKEHLAERECALAEAQGVLRGAAAEMGCSGRALSEVTEDIRKRDNEKIENERKAKNLETKAGQYEVSTVGYREMVRRSGVKRNTTHDAVAKQGEALKEIEQQLADVERELETYGDFPPDIDACAAMVDGTYNEIREVEVEIEGSLKSMMR